MCDRHKSLSFDTTLKLSNKCALRFVCKHFLLTVLYFSGVAVRKASNARSLKVIGIGDILLAIYDFLIVFHCNCLYLVLLPRLPRSVISQIDVIPLYKSTFIYLLIYLKISRDPEHWLAAKNCKSIFLTEHIPNHKENSANTVTFKWLNDNFFNG